MPSRSLNSSDAAFARLREAWRSGRPVVPLFGAGVSACASIPFGPHIVEYLVGMKLSCELTGWHGQCAEYARTRGWPERNQLNAELRARCGPRLPAELARVSRQLAEDVAIDALSRLHSPMRRTLQNMSRWLDFPAPDWLSLLHHITASSDNLIEAFFDGLVRNCRPGNAHRFIAYLAKLAGWRLILTTNFDDLIEGALREEGLRPVVYELVRGGTLPDKDLVARHLSVIKLHGGTFGLRTGFDLHEALDAHSIAMFTAYVPADALVLVVGQGGHEQRVLSLVHALLDTPHSNRRELLWIYYEGEPSALSQRLRARIHTARYGDASLFFHELYQRFAFSHPVGREAYPAIYHLPERLDFERDHRQGSRRGPCRSREDMCELYDKAKTWPVTRLWFNLYQFTSVAAFVSVLLEQLQHNDRTLPALFLSPVVAFSDLEDAHFEHAQREHAQPEHAQREHAQLEHDAEPEGSRAGGGSHRARASREVFRRHIAHALRRQSYFIAIEALNGFANPQSELNVRMDAEQGKAIARALRRELYDFLRSLGECDLGQSELYVSPDPADGASAAADGVASVRSPRFRQGGVTFVAAKPAPPPPAPDLPSRHDIEGLLTRVAISFRKPRPLTALVRLTAKLYEKNGAAEAAAPDRPGVAEKEALYCQIREQIERLVADELLERQDGGLYSMNGQWRDVWFRHFVEHEKDYALQLQYEIAMYYRIDLYQQSRDIAAYLEYVFHRLACIDLVLLGSDRDESIDLEHGWHKLFGSLERERDHVLGRGQAASLLDALCCVDQRLTRREPPGPRAGAVEAARAGAPEPTAAERRAFLAQLRRMRLEIRKSVSDIDYCASEHMRMARAIVPDWWNAQGSPPLVESMRPTGGRLERGSWEKELEHFADELRGRANPGAMEAFFGRAEPSLVLDLIESVLSVAEDAGRLYVVHQESAIPRELTEWALSHTRALEARLGTGSVEARRRAFVEVRGYEGLMDIALRGHNPWSPSAARDNPIAARFGEFQHWFRTARHRLVEFGQRGHGMAEHFSRMRCLLSRGAYLTSRFGLAGEELNRANAFAERASDSSSAAMLAVYYLHRAEYCILFFRTAATRASERERPSSLLDEALMALEQAEAEFGGGRRDVFWMVRLFILRARAYLEQLRSRVELMEHSAEKQAILLGEPSPAESALLSSSQGDPTAQLATEQLASNVLDAIYGSWVNNHQNAQRDALIDEIWDELELLLKRAYQASGRSASEFRTRFEQLNAAAGLDDYREHREARYEFADPLELQVKGLGSIGSTSLWVVNMSTRGILFSPRVPYDHPGSIELGLPTRRARALSAGLRPGVPDAVRWRGNIQRFAHGLVLQLGACDIPARIALKKLLLSEGQQLARLRTSRRPPPTAQQPPPQPAPASTPDSIPHPPGNLPP